MYEQIIVPLDGSLLSEEALVDAQELARRFEAPLVLLRASAAPAQLLAETAAVTAPEVSVNIALEREQNEAAAAEAYLAELRSRLEAEGLRVETHTTQGEPSKAILDYAREAGAGSLIVMTTHGRGGLGKLFYGSVTEDVLKHSPVPVLVKRVEG